MVWSINAVVDYHCGLFLVSLTIRLLVSWVADHSTMFAMVLPPSYLQFVLPVPIQNYTTDIGIYTDISIGASLVNISEIVNYMCI